MNTGRTLRWARRRAGLTQRQLAARTGVSQPTIARIEGGLAMPGVDTFDRLLRGCGLTLEVVPQEGVGVDRTLIRRQLAASPEERLAFAQGGAETRAELSRAGTRPVTPDLIALLQALDHEGVRCVVIGGLAANLLGSPILTNDAAICYARDDANLSSLAAALTTLEATLRDAPADLPFTPDSATLRAGDRFTFDTRFGPLDIMGQPDGTSGYEALRRTARPFTLRGITVWVSSLEDLIAMKRAAGRPKDRLLLEELAALRAERDRLEAQGHDPDAGQR